MTSEAAGSDQPTTGSASYRESHTAAGIGSAYDDIAFGAYDGDLWRDHEVPQLRAWLVEAVADGARVGLDFACGTGRITEVMAEVLDEVVGVDVSDAMLERAAARAPGATLVRRDLTVEEPEGLPVPDVVCAFRFFLNAEPALREAAMSAIAGLIPTGGTFITNVHLNAECPTGRLQTARRRYLKKPTSSLDHATFIDLLDRHGFEVLETRWMGYWPRTKGWFPELGRRMQAPTERAVRRLGVPDRYVARMFLVRARRR